jgi:hypothetical protein
MYHRRDQSINTGRQRFEAAARNDTVAAKDREIAKLNQLITDLTLVNILYLWPTESLSTK